MSSASEAISIVIEEQISFLSKNQMAFFCFFESPFLWFFSSEDTSEDTSETSLIALSVLFPPKMVRFKIWILFTKGWTKKPLTNDWTLISCCWRFSLQSIIGKTWNSIVINPKTAIVTCHLISLLKSKHSWCTSSVTLQLVSV